MDDVSKFGCWTGMRVLWSMGRISLGEKVPVLMSFLPNLGSLSYPTASPEYGAEQDEDPIFTKK